MFYYIFRAIGLTDQKSSSILIYFKIHRSIYTKGKLNEIYTMCLSKLKVELKSGECGLIKMLLLQQNKPERWSLACIFSPV
jgi:hypothetical protein